jgi:CheY-like chemotaxis protein
LKGIEAHVASATSLTSRLLGFARGGKYEVRPTDLNALIDQSLQMFGRTKKEIQIHTKYRADLGSVEVDANQIEQVLLNLFVNAWQAMPGGGTLYVSTDRITFSEKESNISQVPPGEYVKFSVTDTGIGMDENTRARIFDPFFTTKELGRATGLGLASVYGIIKNHNGVINVYSEKGQGSTFNVYLPASTKTVVNENRATQPILKGSEKVLLVDDEDIIIDVGREILESLGYSVVTALSGESAIDLYKRDPDIDLVILDMIMPEMGGGEVFDQLRQINPEVKVILSSGYSLNGQAIDIMERGCSGFIQKPFSVEQISIKIREVLESANHGD